MDKGTLNDLFQGSVKAFGHKAAMKYKRDAQWHAITYDMFGQFVEDASLGLQALGVEAGDRVAIFSENGPEWAIADFATLHAGAMSVPIYTTLTPDQVTYILNDCEAKVILVQNTAFLDIVQNVRDQVPSLQEVILMERLEKPPEGVLTLEDLYTKGREHGEANEGAYKDRWSAVGPDDLASLVYTSGTTGNPKGVMLSHGNFRTNVEATLQVLPISAEDIHLSFLPLSHSFERMGGHYVMYRAGVTVAFAESVPLVPQNLQEIRPTIMMSVPRLYEKMYARITAAVEDAPALRQNLFKWATGTGAEVHQRLENGQPIPAGLRMKYRVADKLVLGKLRNKLGMDRLRLAVSGGAALNKDLATFFGSLGVMLLEGYGLTESSPVIAVNRPDRFRVGTVGLPVPDVEVKLDVDNWEGEEGEGELWARGPNIMKGYWNKPEATAETITEDGWLKTGDVAQFDEDGFIRITDRKKELFKTAYGKYIAPQHLENLLKAQPHVGMAVILGADRKYVAVLLQPDFESLEPWAKEKGITFNDRADLVAHPDVKAHFDKVIETANADLARYEQVKTYRILPRELEVGKELTPTLKVKRRIVEDEWDHLIMECYPEEAKAKATA